jgi:hypothetical protein
MSDGLYSTRLRWHGGPAGIGIARLHDRSVSLWSPPVIGGHPVHDIDYAPEVRMCQVRLAPWSQVVDMTPEHIADAEAALAAAHRVGTASPTPLPVEHT